MSGMNMGSGARANMDAYSNMAALGTPQMGPLTGYKPEVWGMDRNQAFDLKSPLAGFAMNMAMQQMAPKQGAPMQAPQHILGLQPTTVQPFQRQLYTPTPMGRLYG